MGFEAKEELQYLVGFRAQNLRYCEYHAREPLRASFRNKGYTKFYAHNIIGFIHVNWERCLIFC